MYKQANKTLATEIQRLSKLDGTLVKEANRAIQKKQAATDAKKKPPTSFIPMPPAKQEVQWKGIMTSISTTSPDIENISDSENSLKTDLDTDASLKDAKSTEQTIGKIVEEMPLYPGGIAALMKWLNKTIIYPAFCIRQNIEGNVEVTFIVNKDGSLSDFKVSKSVHAYLDSEALRVVRKMQKWIPGKHNGKVANVCITLPIEFKLN
ncbi:MAG: TonB family protein [Bacteroidaceae bacterium]